MAYCTLTDILAVMDEQDVIQFTDDDDAGMPNVVVVDAVTASAAALIDSYISGRYGTSLNPVPALVVSLAVDLSLYQIASRRGAAPVELRTRYEDAVRLLERISLGRAEIPDVVMDDDNAGTDNPAAAVVAQAQVYSGPGSGLGGY
eukprot:TRINITY_DN16792_c0_g1_i1.p4 TRINITY_DN16792_c0_g1~~TRINITY_DN16792_c0_g1_i1.p4  ORF type:complete len:146 (+),score=39.84 TRINITY_DN16792_c0_g1_i1:284-721(+)